MLRYVTICYRRHESGPSSHLDGLELVTLVDAYDSNNPRSCSTSSPCSFSPVDYGAEEVVSVTLAGSEPPLMVGKTETTSKSAAHSHHHGDHDHNHNSHGGANEKGTFLLGVGECGGVHGHGEGGGKERRRTIQQAEGPEDDEGFIGGEEDSWVGGAGGAMSRSSEQGHNHHGHSHDHGHNRSSSTCSIGSDGLCRRRNAAASGTIDGMGSGGHFCSNGHGHHQSDHLANGNVNKSDKERIGRCRSDGGGEGGGGVEECRGHGHHHDHDSDSHNSHNGHSHGHEHGHSHGRRRGHGGGGGSCGGGKSMNIWAVFVHAVADAVSAGIVGAQGD